MTIKILADSACDLPYTFFEKEYTELIPLRVHIDQNEYEDLISIQPEQVYDAIRNGKLPKTSQASPLTLEKIFISIAENNETGIYVAFSSELSGTFGTALMVKEQVKEQYPQLDLTIIDSKCASLGYGLVVKNATEQVEKGGTKEEVLSQIHQQIHHMEHLFTVEDLEYMARGGRVSKASAFIGGLLNIKPLLHVEEGKLVPIEKLRGRKKLIQRILFLMDERGDSLEDQTIGISHGDDLALAQEMQQLIQEKFGTTDFYIHTIGSAVGAHAGPGTLAIFFLNKQ
ncbi:DegV family protein [Bacillus sp. 2205SS5-2]|uniref:DegV family protein n=1 Tax=Bacillus sp. 2205SS5-2 TaxID=3109031 RepID=UPI00300426C8